MRISELVKTYRWINDPDAPPWNVRFAGAIVLIAVVAAGVGGLYFATRVDPNAAGSAYAAAGEAAAADKRLFREYVGFPPDATVVDSKPAEAALAAWKARNPDVEVLSEEPERAPSGAVAGYHVTYRA